MGKLQTRVMEKVKLTSKTTIKFLVEGPFSFEKTFYSPSHFPSKLELYTPNGFYVSFRWDDILLGLRVYPNGHQLGMDVYSQRPLGTEVIE